MLSRLKRWETNTSKAYLIWTQFADFLSTVKAQFIVIIIWHLNRLLFRLCQLLTFFLAGERNSPNVTYAAPFNDAKMQ